MTSALRDPRNHFPDPRPGVCVVRADERQWLPPGGQRWTTLADLAAAGHAFDVREVEPGLTGIGADPPVAIGQRSLLVATPGATSLGPVGVHRRRRGDRGPGGGRAELRHRQPPALLRRDRPVGGAFGAEILVLADDAGLAASRTRRLGPDLGRTPDVLPGVTLIQCGGHFPGSAVLHWADGADGRGALLTPGTRSSSRRARTG